MQISSKSEIIVGAFSALLSVFFALTINGSWNIILATVLASFLGVYISGNN
jgi:uncharacterized membrane protein YjjP (DUF1212 family)